MTAWTITLSDGGTYTVEADELTTRSDGSLWALRADLKPRALAPVLILARGQWRAVHPVGTQLLRELPELATEHAPTPRFA